MPADYTIDEAATPLSSDLSALIQKNSDVPWNDHTLSHWAALPTSWILVCCQGEKVLGAILWQCVAEYAEIANIVVSADERQKGVGTVLLQNSIAALRAKEIRHLSLEVRASNTAASMLYEKMGFKRVACRASYYQTEKKDIREDAFVYQLEI